MKEDLEIEKQSNLAQTVGVCERDNEEILVSALSESDQIQKLKERLKETEIEETLPVVTTDEPDSQQIIEQTLETLRELKPEARQYYLRQIVTHHYGVNVSDGEKGEVVPYDATIEEKVVELGNQIEKHPKRIGIYLEERLYSRFNVKNLNRLVDASVIDKTDVEIYHAAVKRIHKSLNKKRLLDQKKYGDSIFFSGATTFGVLGNSAAGALAMFTGEVGFIVLWIPNVIGAFIGGAILKEKMKSGYEDKIAKECQNYPGLELDITVAREYAQNMKEQLMEQPSINPTYLNKLGEFSGFKKQAIVYLDSSIKTLDKLIDP